MKKLFIGILAVLALVVGAIIYVVSTGIDSRIAGALETHGPRILGASVRVDGVSLEPGSGSGAIRGLVIGAPAGFGAAKTLSVGEITLRVDPASLLSDMVVIRRIAVVAPDITYEVSAAKGTNIAAIQRSIDAFVASMGRTGGGDGGGGKKIVIEDFSVVDGVVGLAATDLGGRGGTVKLPPVHLTGIGRKSNGVTGAEAAKQILAGLQPAIAQAAAQLGVDTVARGALDEGRRRLEQGAGGLAGGIGGAVGDAGKGLGGAVEGLFGK